MLLIFQKKKKKKKKMKTRAAKSFVRYVFVCTVSRYTRTFILFQPKLVYWRRLDRSFASFWRI